MYLTYGVYVLILVLLLWGGRFAGINKYHEDFMSLSATKSLRGIAAILIIFHHLSQQQTFQQTGEIQAFLNMGPVLVAIFFFCSGYGLVKSYNEKPGYLNGFIKKRIVKGVLITFYVNVVLYGIFYALTGVGYEPTKWIANIVGINLMNEYAWFPIVLAILYLAFYLIYKKVKNKKMRHFLMFVVLLTQGASFAFSGHFTWWAGPKNWWLMPGAMERAAWWERDFAGWYFGQWWVNSSIGFLLGMIFADYEMQIVAWFKKLYWLKLVVCIIAFVGSQILSVAVQHNIGYYSEYSGMGPGIAQKFITYLAQLPQMTMVVIVVFAFLMKYRTENPVTRFFGKYAFDTYLMNLMAISSLDFLITKNNIPIVKPYHYNLMIDVLAVFALSILLGIVEYYIVAFIKKKIK